MLKKLAITLAASAFALTLAAPIASACPGMEGKQDKTAQNDDAKDSDAETAKNEKTAKKEKKENKKVAKKGDDTAKQ